MERLEDPYYLPSRDEIVSQCKNGLSAFLRDRKQPLSQTISCELVTRDLIE
jgi:hypothetical protein